MGFVKKEKNIVKYSNESITETLVRKDGKPWDANNSATYSIYNSDGEKVTEGTLSVTDQNMGFRLFVPKEDTIELEGNYLLLVELQNSTLTGMNEGIAEYHINFKRRTSKIS